MLITLRDIRGFQSRSKDIMVHWKKSYFMELFPLIFSPLFSQLLLFECTSKLVLEESNDGEFQHRLTILPGRGSLASGSRPGSILHKHRDSSFFSSNNKEDVLQGRKYVGYESNKRWTRGNWTAAWWYWNMNLKNDPLRSDRAIL